MGNRHPPITKSSGATVRFEADKLRNSLLRAGATKALADAVTKQVKGMLYPGISTEEIYRKAYALLRAQSEGHAGRYRLKQALLELGSSGFPFEQFVAALMRHEGFEVEVDLILPGRCVKHELDVVARRDSETRFVECKYHQQRGQKTDVKVALYIHARYMDLEAQLQSHHPQAWPHFQGWLITNTRFSDDALTYGRCAGLQLVAWDFPTSGNLKEMVETSGLFPISCLGTLTPAEKEELLNENIILCRDLPHQIHALKRAGLTDTRIHKALEEAASIGDSMTGKSRRPPNAADPKTR